MEKGDADIDGMMYRPTAIWLSGATSRNWKWGMGGLGVTERENGYSLTTVLAGAVDVEECKIGIHVINLRVEIA